MISLNNHISWSILFISKCSFQILVYWTSCKNRKSYLPALHTTPASSEWPQSWIPVPEWVHDAKDVSLPVQETSSSKIVPVPCPNLALPGADIGDPCPSCRQTTWASVVLHPSSQTVPHSLLMYTSTRPSLPVLPPMRRTFQCPDGSWWTCTNALIK